MNNWIELDYWCLGDNRINGLRLDRLDNLLTQSEIILISRKGELNFGSLSSSSNIKRDALPILLSTA